MPLSTMLPVCVESGRGLCMLRVWVAWMYVIEGVSGDYCLDRVPFRRWQRRQHERDPPRVLAAPRCLLHPPSRPFWLVRYSVNIHSRPLLNQ